MLLAITPTRSVAPAAVSFVLGLGFWFYSVVIILAAQSAVGWGGVVTSANQFARNIGARVGKSIAGAIFTAGAAQPAGSTERDSSPAVWATLAATDPGSRSRSYRAPRLVYVLSVAAAALARGRRAVAHGRAERELIRGRGQLRLHGAASLVTVRGRGSLCPPSPVAARSQARCALLPRRPRLQEPCTGTRRGASPNDQLADFHRARGWPFLTELAQRCGKRGAAPRKAESLLARATAAGPRRRAPDPKVGWLHETPQGSRPGQFATRNSAGPPTRTGRRHATPQGSRPVIAQAMVVPMRPRPMLMGSPRPRGRGGGAAVVASASASRWGSSLVPNSRRDSSSSSSLGTST